MTAVDDMKRIEFNVENADNECAGAHHEDARTAPEPDSMVRLTV
jgi:hypothetical protein